MNKTNFKEYNIGDSITWQGTDAEGGRGLVVKREPYKAWAKCEETGEVIEVNLRRSAR